MKNYYRVMLGRKSAHAAECLLGNFIGTDFDIEQDLTAHRELSRLSRPSPSTITE